ncbi:MAG: ABC transporter ATP-binding protein [Acidobacteriota bacterium]|nr:ABC transporter ATP-binding protein [Acidobacteriota bacterium]
MLKITGLTKTYGGQILALRNVDLEVPPGVFGLLGPNGSGKTTLMKILATLLEPDSGRAEMNGIDLINDPHGTRKQLGYLPQEFGFYPTFTASQMLDYFAKLKGVTDRKERARLVDALLDRVNLSAARKQRLGGFSGGMRQRLGIAQALIGQPQLIIVDEPTAGLDPEERNRFHNLLVETASENVLVILSTHIVSDVSSICSHMAIIRRGEILACGTPRQAVSELDGRVWEANLSREQLATLKPLVNVVSSQMSDGLVRVRVISKGERPTEDFSPTTPTLEDCYFSVVSQANG